MTYSLTSSRPLSSREFHRQGCTDISWSKRVLQTFAEPLTPMLLLIDDIQWMLPEEINVQVVNEGLKLIYQMEGFIRWARRAAVCVRHFDLSRESTFRSAEAGRTTVCFCCADTSAAVFGSRNKRLHQCLLP